ncbi:hypothetical protein MHBO_003615, partial [Bonamia ostreae]
EKVKKKTRTINGNGFNPVWQQEFNFSIPLKNSEIAMILFRVYSDNSLKGKTLLASNAFPVRLLKKGFFLKTK